MTEAIVHTGAGALRSALVADGRQWMWRQGHRLPILFGSQDDVDDDDDVDSTDIPEEEDDESTASDSDNGDARVKELSEEAKRHRLRAKKYRQDAERQQGLVDVVARHFQKDLSSLTPSSLAELLKSTGPDGDERTKELEQGLRKSLDEVDRLNNELSKRDIDGAIRDELLARGMQPKRVPSAMRLIDRDDIEVDGGAVEGVSDAVDKIVSDFPEWMTTPPSDDGTNGEKPPAAKATGKRAGTSKLDTEYLRDKFPALRR